MELVESIEKRWSVRSFTADPVPEEMVLETLRMGTLAPSAGNLQARDFIVVRDPETRKQLAKAAFGQDFVEQAPVVIVCCSNQARIRNYGVRGTDLYCLQDTAAAAENMLLYITSREYGSCWVGAFDEMQVGRLLGLPENVRPTVMLPIGKPQEVPRRTPRLKIDTVVHREKW
jgi:nitroreductase